jgi:hypothetical protein
MRAHSDANVDFTHPHLLWPTIARDTGRWQYVLVDGVVGCIKDAAGVLVPAFAHSEVPGELWPIILEKAYMKVRVVHARA